MIYTDDGHLMSVARIAKIKFNENAKRPSFFNAFPELNHNEMIGFTVPLGKFAALYCTTRPACRGSASGST